MSAASIRGQQTGGFALGRWLSLTLRCLARCRRQHQWRIRSKRSSVIGARELATANGDAGPFACCRGRCERSCCRQRFCCRACRRACVGAPLTTFSLKLQPLTINYCVSRAVRSAGRRTFLSIAGLGKGNGICDSKTYAELNYQLLGARVDNGSDRVDLNRLHLSVVPSNERDVSPVSRTDWEIDGLQIMLLNGERWSVAAEAIDWQHTAEPGRSNLYAQLDQQLSQWTGAAAGRSFGRSG